MDGVQFEDEKFRKQSVRTAKEPLVITALLKTGIFRSRGQALNTLLILSAALFIFAGYLFYTGTTPEQFESDNFPEGYLNDPNYIEKYGTQ